VYIFGLLVYNYPFGFIVPFPRSLSLLVVRYFSFPKPLLPSESARSLSLFWLSLTWSGLRQVDPLAACRLGADGSWCCTLICFCFSFLVILTLGSDLRWLSSTYSPDPSLSSSVLYSFPVGLRWGVMRCVVGRAVTFHLDYLRPASHLFPSVTSHHPYLLAVRP